MDPIRTSAKAVIIEHGRVVAVKKQDEHGVFYILPGGGQEPGETLVEALRRECQEELRADVSVGDLWVMREYIARHHEFAAQHPEVHQIEFMFLCSLADGVTVVDAPLVEDQQLGVEWLELEGLERSRLYPKALRALIAGLGRRAGRLTIYLGDVN
jgi:8-oxo-dGTP diphosphatase